MAVANQLGDRARSALESADGGDDLLKLCKELRRNVPLAIGGYEATLAHHIALANLGQQGLECLKELIRTFGNSSLTAKDSVGKTVVHVAAQNQDATWLQLMRKSLAKNAYKERGQYQRTCTHFAALNSRSDSALAWLVTQLGPNCLVKPDEHHNTALHLAAWTQGPETMKFISMHANSIFKPKTAFFTLQGGHGRTVLHLAAMNESHAGTFLWLVENCSGGEHLTVRDNDQNTPVHLAALNQSFECVQAIEEKACAEVFRIRGQYGTTAVHCAAMNTKSNTTLAWLTRTLGQGCLLDADAYGATPVELAARQNCTASMGATAETGRGDREQMTQPPLLPGPSQLSQDCATTDSDSQKMMRQSESEIKPHEDSNELSGNLKEHSETASYQTTELLTPPTPDPSFVGWDFILKNGKKCPIGAGGFGKVYKAFTDKHQTVAVKLVKLIGACDAAEQEKVIEQEKIGIEILKTIRHPNIMLFLRCERTADNRFCIFTQLVAGHSLSDLIRRQQKPFDESGVHKFALQILSALKYLHCRKPAILHRDIKCSNIMLTHEGVIKLIDFGLAKEIFSTTVAHITLTPCGTWCYMAPELFATEAGRVVYTRKTDVWAFGCTVFEMLEMQPPNTNLTVFQIQDAVRKKTMPDLTAVVSDRLRNFYRRCVVRDPQERADTAELLEDLFFKGGP